MRLNMAFLFKILVIADFFKGYKKNNARKNTTCEEVFEGFASSILSPSRHLSTIKFESQRCICKLGAYLNARANKL